MPADFKPAPAGAVTHLLHDQQIHAELRQTYFHAALRLESMQAIQTESPWRLDFDPSTEQILVHWIQTWRDGAPCRRADLSQSRIFDRREAGASPAKPLTLTVMLEDLRPGDILEWSYTIETCPILLPENCAALFSLPPEAPVGAHYFSLIFDTARPMRWKSS